jgi:hypothetical protein
VTWADHHTQSEKLASEADIAARGGDAPTALTLYAKAAVAEEKALEALSPNKARTLGITAVSAASLWLMGREYQRAQQVAYRWLSTDQLPSFAVSQLRDLLQTIWGEEMRSKSDVTFLPGDITVSVSGGEVLYGGAPLDLILRKVEEMKAFVIRTIEMKLGQPLRKTRTPSDQVSDFFEPWLIQQPAGSYQFAIRIRTPRQIDLFPEQIPEVATVTSTTLDILRATAEDPEKGLPQVVADEEYQKAFLKLARNLAPTGKSFAQLSVGSVTAAAAPVVMLPAAREGINQALRERSPRIPQADTPNEVQIRGVLRGLSLNKDWLEVTVTDRAGKSEDVRVWDAKETLDDVIGPMVNRKVVIDAFRKPGTQRLHLRDIQSEE